MRRVLGAISALALAASLAVVSLAAVGTAPAGAAPVTLTITGDHTDRNPPAGAWTWEGGQFSELQTLITTGTFGDATFTLGTPVATVTDAALANVDVYFSSAVAGGYTTDEEQALLRFVQRGGVLIANTNSHDFDVTDFLGATVVPTPSWYAEAPAVNQRASPPHHHAWPTAAHPSARRPLRANAHDGTGIERTRSPTSAHLAPGAGAVQLQLLVSHPAGQCSGWVLQQQRQARYRWRPRPFARRSSAVKRCC
jgi:hypothetical protein